MKKVFKILFFLCHLQLFSQITVDLNILFYSCEGDGNWPLRKISKKERLKSEHKQCITGKELKKMKQINIIEEGIEYRGDVQIEGYKADKINRKDNIDNYVIMKVYYYNVDSTFVVSECDTLTVKIKDKMGRCCYANVIIEKREEGYYFPIVSICPVYKYRIRLFWYKFFFGLKTYNILTCNVCEEKILYSECIKCRKKN